VLRRPSTSSDKVMERRVAPKRKIAQPLQRLKLKDLLRATPSDIISRAGTQCRIMRKEYAYGSRDNFKRVYVRNRTYYNEFRAWVMCTDGRRNSYLRFYGPPEKDSEVWVWCSCPYFTFNLEVALARRNSSVVRNSNGALPRVRNPAMIPHLCKHLVLISNSGVKETRDLAAEKMAEEMGRAEEAEKQAIAHTLRPKKKLPRDKFVKPSNPNKFVDLK